MAQFGEFHPSTRKPSRSWAWVFWLFILIGLVICLNIRFGLTPPLGKFLSPYEGAFQITLQDYQKPGNYSLNGKDGKIEIRLDADLIPHISAASLGDAFMAQGFISAQHRLWQMDFQNLAATGRLSEVIGEKTLELDKFQRRFGIAEAAENSGREMMRNPQTRYAIESYAAGVNVAIENWPTRQLPLEFKVLDYKPSLWKTTDPANLLKRMAFVLAGNSEDKTMNLILERFGKSVVDQLFPAFLHGEIPIITPGTPFNFKPLPIPPVPLSLGWTDTTDSSIPENIGPKLKDDDAVGSNNWAVSGQKTKSGFPILANDPHLNMKLPSTWYMAEIQAPGYHCMGASLPGAPGIISGFNEQFAWGVTNGYPDVTDWYRIEFKDQSRKFYWAEGKWMPTRIKVEKIKLRNGNMVKDTVYWTHLGPVVYKKGEKPNQDNVPEGYALRWVAHDPGNELLTFLRLNQIKSIKQVPWALKTYLSPAQNFVAADQSGNIAMFAQQGKIPLRWKDQGKFLLLAADSGHAWKGFIPKEHLPKEINPARGYVSSANQIPTDTTYPYYLNWNYYAVERGKRINQLLDSGKGFTLENMGLVQNDNFNLWAEKTLPLMLEAARNLGNKAKWMTDILQKWNLRNDPKEAGPTLFEAWFDAFMHLAWSDNFGPGMRYPDKHVTWQIFLEKDNSDWFDFSKTKELETGSKLISMALQRASDSLQKKLGTYVNDPMAYQWGNYKATQIGHLGMMAGLGTGVLFTGGGKGIVNATGPSNGQSWKMLVELGPKPRALGIYPGGQSGNPSSVYYDNFIEPWRTGQHKILKFSGD
jgi:penicillin amidase